MSQSPSTRENRLRDETSPYLLQHKHNPVEWWPWGPAALAEARRTSKPILLSVGYAACHWCHVMAHESFEDDDVAAVMNALYVNIKVDREERPDVDQIYMAALHLLGEPGGWPLTMFLTPDAEPVWGGTYFPKTARYGRPGFVDVLQEIARLFRDEPARIDHNRRALMRALKERTQSQAGVAIGVGDLDDIAQRVAERIDPVLGGLRGAPKFPQTAILELVWRAGLRGTRSRCFDLVELTLDRICNGGIYDHLGGGFSRYSVDETWLVPHFEKMLYDNAQLLDLLAVGFARTPRPLYRERARETVDWLRREMLTHEGAFAASLDADSEGQEGKFYVWSLDAIEQALGPTDAAFFASHYDVTAGGNFEGHSILNRLSDRPLSLNPEHPDEQRLAGLRAKLLGLRAQRVRPGCDDKILADWNGLMIAALAHAGCQFDEPSWITLASGAFTFIAGAMTREDRLGHSWRAGRLLFPGLGSDFAAMIAAALALFEATGEAAYLEQALRWQRALDRHYGDPNGTGYFLTADDAEGLVLRPHSSADEASPNLHAVTAQNLVRLAVLSGEDQWREQADALLDSLLTQVSTNVLAHAGVLNALDLRLRAAEIVIGGTDSHQHALVDEALKLPFLERIVRRANVPGHPAHEPMAGLGRAAAVVCVGSRCSLPVTDRAGLTAAVAAMRGALPSDLARSS
jgi:uncharacterized protein YyaL (SSP411 family)